MPRLDPKQRAKLPGSAFAYVDSRGRKRLPIHDESHVRNALARFSQVHFENDAARERARKRLLQAAKKFRIMPLGFITRQLESERKQATAGPPGTAADAVTLPTGFVTFVMTDIEQSTVLLRQLGDRYGELIDKVRAILRRATAQSGGREIDARGDEFFAVFEKADGAVAAAAAMQRAMAKRRWPDPLNVRVRIGIHSGSTRLTNVGYIGLAVHTVARVCSTAHGGQIVVSGDTVTAAEPAPRGIAFRSLGRRRLAGLPQPQTLHQVEADGLLAEFPPPRTGRAR